MKFTPFEKNAVVVALETLSENLREIHSDEAVSFGTEPDQIAERIKVCRSAIEKVYAEKSQTRYTAYGMFDSDMTDDEGATFDTMEEAKEYAFGRMFDPDLKAFFTVDGMPGWYGYPETNAFLITVLSYENFGDWETIEEIEITKDDYVSRGGR